MTTALLNQHALKASALADQRKVVDAIMVIVLTVRPIFLVERKTYVKETLWAVSANVMQTVTMGSNAAPVKDV